SFSGRWREARADGFERYKAGFMNKLGEPGVDVSNAISQPCYICLVRLAACLLISGICFPVGAQDEPAVKFGTTVVANSGFKGLVYHIHRGSQRLPDFRKMKPA